MLLDGRTPTVEDVPKLEYTRAMIAESMRLYSPAWTMGRRAIETHTHRRLRDRDKMRW